MDAITPLSQELAQRAVLNTLETLATGGLADEFFASLTYREATTFADFLLANGAPSNAGAFMREWRDNDEDWEEWNEDGAVDAWIALEGAADAL